MGTGVRERATEDQQAGSAVTTSPRPVGGTTGADLPARAPRLPVRPVEAGAGFVLLIGLLTLLPAVTTDMYLPSLPDVATDLRTSEAGAQFTITGMLIGGALGQLFAGPLSDRVGRRKPVLAGITAHAVLSLLCVVAGSIVVLSTLRVLQGLASAFATVVAMAVIRDRYAGSEAARLISRLMLVISAAPLLAPTAGSVIADAWGWRAVFVALALLALLLGVVVALFLPETLPPARRTSHGVGEALRGYRSLLADRTFLAYGLVPGFGMALIIGYVAGSPFVFQGLYGLDEQQFALVFAVGGTSLVTGSQLNAALVRRVGPLRLLRAGLPATVLAAAVMTAVGVSGLGGLVGLVAAIWLTTALLGFVMANASALALSRHGERAGTAASVIGFVQSGLAGLVSPLVGVLGGGVGAMTGVMLGSMVAALVVLAVGTPAYRRS